MTESEHIDRLTRPQKLLLGVLLVGVLAFAITAAQRQQVEAARVDELRRIEQRLDQVVDVVNLHANCINQLQADLAEIAAD